MAFQADTFGHSREQAVLSSLMVDKRTIIFSINHICVTINVNDKYNRGLMLSLLGEWTERTKSAE